jgi:hypothetical protein
MPDSTISIFLPDFRNSLVCSAMDSEVSLAAAAFDFVPVWRIGFPAMGVVSLV